MRKKNQGIIGKNLIMDHLTTIPFYIEFLTIKASDFQRLCRQCSNILEFDVNYASLANLTNARGVELVTKK